MCLDGNSLLHLSIQQGQLALARYLLCREEVDVVLENNKEQTPLHMFASSIFFGTRIEI